MNEKEGIKSSEFVLRAVVVAAAAVLVLFCVKVWIVDPVLKRPAQTEAAAAVSDVPAEKNPGFTAEKPWDKTKKVISWKDAANHLDDYVETEGVIVSSYRGAKVSYLNFDKNYKETLSLVIFNSNLNRFPDKPEKYYLNKKVKVEGRIKDYKGRVEIILGSKEQITIVQ